MVGDEQTIGKVDSALSHAGGEVISVPEEFVVLAVMETALLLVASTVASPAVLMPTICGFPDVQVTELVMFWVLLSL